jgi:hypothetical protein
MKPWDDDAVRDAAITHWGLLFANGPPSQDDRQAP